MCVGEVDANFFSGGGWMQKKISLWPTYPPQEIKWSIPNVGYLWFYRNEELTCQSQTLIYCHHPKNMITYELLIIVLMACNGWSSPDGVIRRYRRKSHGIWHRSVDVKHPVGGEEWLQHVRQDTRRKLNGTGIFSTALAIVGLFLAFSYHLKIEEIISIYRNLIYMHEMKTEIWHL